MLGFLRVLPKVELHAHLNGSIGEEMMRKLLMRKQEREPETADKCAEWQTCVQSGQSRTLAEIFEMFSCIHQICESKEDLHMVTCDVIENFAKDNVRYLELRTTPRNNQKTGLSKQIYVQTVLDAIEESMAKFDIQVYLLLAIDRRGSTEEAWDTLNLAVRHFEKSKSRVVGIDLSGDPYKGDARDFIPVLKEAKRQGLKLAIHLAEIPGLEEETLSLLAIPPDRIGHGTFLHPETGGTEQLVCATKKNSVPLEICLTSNIKTQTSASFDAHHFKHWLQEGHPCVICTDDMGVFCTSLTEEYLIASQVLELSAGDLWKLSLDSIDYIFAEKQVKDKLKDHWHSVKDDVFSKLPEET